jgi:heptosyltransferase-2
MNNLNPRSILIRCPNWVGDVVMCTPALRSIRQRFPQARIAVLIKPSLRRVLENFPYIDEIIEWDPKGRHRGLKSYLAFVRMLRQRSFDLGIAMTSSFSSAQLLFLAGIPVRVGYSRNCRGFLLTLTQKPLREKGKIVPVNKVEMDLGLCELLGCTELSTRTELGTSAEARGWVEAFFEERGITAADFIVCVIPGATFGPSKCWKEDYFASVCDGLIAEYGAKILVLPGPGELPIARRIIGHMQKKPVDMGDTIVPLDVLIALISSCGLLITNDTGPRHFGVAFDKPVVVIMGSTDSRHTDCNLEKTVVLQQKVDCGPCHLRVCPTDHRCMTLITPDMVLAAAREMIERYALIAAS